MQCVRGQMGYERAQNHLSYKVMSNDFQKGVDVAVPLAIITK